MLEIQFKANTILSHFRCLKNRNLGKNLEVQGIDPRTSRMLSERSTIGATPPDVQNRSKLFIISDKLNQLKLA